MQKVICYLRFKPNCLDRHSLCKEANWGLPTQHFQKGIVWVSIKNIKKKNTLEQLERETLFLACILL